MAKKRYDRAGFYSKLDPLDADGLRKILWNLYWRAPAALRERIEDALEPEQAARKRKTEQEVDGVFLLDDVLSFVALARSGAYFAGSREVSRTERTKWRVTFKGFVNDAATLLRCGDVKHGGAAMEALIDLACEMSAYNYFRSEDPVAAARFVVSDAAHHLWRRRLEEQGFAAFAQSAADQLIRWERRYGWTRDGGPVAEREVPLAQVLKDLLRGQDALEAFTDAYVTVLDEHAPKARADGARRKGRRSASSETDWHERSELRRRSENLAEWHAWLLDRLDVHDPERRLDRIASHPALKGPDSDFMQAQISRLRGDDQRARRLIEKCLKDLPGDGKFDAFARELGVSSGKR